MRRDVLIAVVGMALVTYLTRAGGVWAGRGPLRAWVSEGPLPRRLAHLPGAVLVAIVVPMVARGGIADLGAALVALVVAARTRSPMATIAVGCSPRRASATCSCREGRRRWTLDDRRWPRASVCRLASGRAGGREPRAHGRELPYCVTVAR